MARRVTIVDVAREAGVAISTVSAALNDRDGVAETTRTRIRTIADDLGWVPSVRGRSLVSQRAWAVGLIIHRQATVLEADPFFAGFLGGVEEVLDAAGYSLVLQIASGERFTDRLRKMALSSIVDGVFLTDVLVDDPRFELVHNLGLPAVAVNATPDQAGIASVTQDHESALGELIRHVIDLGHTCIAHVGGTPGLVHTRARERVWRESLEAAGLPPGPLAYGDFTSEGGVKALDELLAGPARPTAVCCANDLTAIGLSSRAAALGMSLPDDLSVTGFDGIQLGAYMTPPLTTVQTSPRALGAASARSLLQAMDDDLVTQTSIEPARLVIRGSAVSLAD